MPPDAVAAAVGAAHDRPSSLQGVRSIATALDASVSATIARLHVLEYIDDAEEDAVKDELGIPR